MDPETLLNNFDIHLKPIRSWLEANESLVIEELWEGPKTLITALAKLATKKNIVLITNHTHFLEEIPSVLEFPSWDILPSEMREPPLDIMGERFNVLKKIKDQKGPHIILAPFQAILEKVLTPDNFYKNQIVLKKGDEISFKELPELLMSFGFKRNSVASEKGEFAIRGGIIDLFPSTALSPYRIEFEEDKILSLRIYDPISQISQKKVDELFITATKEYSLLDKEGSTLFDYLGKETIVIFDDLLELEDKFVLFQQSFDGILPKQFLSLNELFEKIKDLQKIYFTENPLEELSEVVVVDKEKKNPYGTGVLPQKVKFSAFNQELIARRWHHFFFPLYPTFCPREIPIEQFSSEDFLKTLLGFPIKVEFLSSTDSDEHSLKQKIKEPNAELIFSKGYLTNGFFLKDPKPYALVPTSELTHRFKVHRTRQRVHYHALAHEVFSLNPGEVVVHMQNGIGRFLGIEKRPNHLGVQTEFMLLEYAEGAKLYVPMEQASQISKYVGTTEAAPEFHTIGSSRWKSMRERTERAIIDYAHDLLELQAERVLKEGFSYPPNSALVNQFSDEFPYNETPDQSQAIKNVYGDMMSKRPMDRLVCGDVGYGKTEVAMRAAFKAVVDGKKQVAILVPTTVLAMQHYENFLSRMGSFSLNVAVLSRFRTPKEIKKTIEDTSNGLVDILIGTHRIVSSDVTFKDLGLIIIDEEQRFGVKVKEHLKKLKKEVDCLTLSATPIPRTLYLSLVGAREMSLINTPPEDRLPIQSIVAELSDDLMKSVLLRELSRNGQAYVIHNRVETIYGFADKIRTLLPGARVIVGHGQMSGDELDTVFHTFKNGNADILVSTSIIENGIDIPNANTILIDRADRFGLADLYQMRGRVGRWNKKAYCYFLVQNLRDLNDIARKRLTALVESSGFGGGMKIAMRDLEIRGAGNILGLEQSGHITAIGFNLYCKMLKKAVNALQKKRGLVFTGNLKIEFPFDARLPENYINETNLRIEIYQRLGDAEETLEIDEIEKEMVDRFGALPEQAKWLLAIAKIRLFAEPRHFTHLKIHKGIFFATQTFDKKKMIERSLAFTLPKQPKELEEKVISLLKEQFPVPF